MLGVCECSANALVIEVSSPKNGTFCLRYFPKSFITKFLARVQRLSGQCLEVSGGYLGGE